LEEIADLKVFPECFCGPLKCCGGPHFAYGALFAHPCHKPMILCK